MYCTSVKISENIKVDIFDSSMFRVRKSDIGFDEKYEIPFAIGHTESWEEVDYSLEKKNDYAKIDTKDLSVLVYYDGTFEVYVDDTLMYPSTKPSYGLFRNKCIVFDSASSVYERNNNSRYAHWFYNKENGFYDIYLKEDKIFDLFFIYGDTYEKAYYLFNKLTGPVPMLPKKIFGFIQTQHLMNEGTQEKFMALAKDLREKEIPCDVLILDLEWGDAFDEEDNLVEWGSRIEWSGKYRKPLSPKEMIKKLNDMNFDIILNSHAVPNFEGRSDMPISVPSGYTGIPHAPEVWESSVKKLFDVGVRGMWQDQRNADMTLAYMWQKQQNFDLNKRVWFLQCYEMFNTESWDLHNKPIPNTKLLGFHRYPFYWTGDCDCSWNELEYQVRACINEHGPLKGVSYLSSDAIAKNYKVQARWHQFLCMTPIIKNHTQKPWMPEFYADTSMFNFNQDDRENTIAKNNSEQAESAEAIIKKFIEIHYTLIPYIYTYAYKYTMTGMPITRPMMVAFPDDNRLNQNQWNMEYMLGDNILVAPVCRDLNSMEICFPKETKWIDYFDGHVYESGEAGSVIDYDVTDLSKMPIFIKMGSIMVTVDKSLYMVPSERTQRLYADIYAEGENSFTLYEDDGETNNYKDGISAFTNIKYKVGENEISIEIDEENNGLAEVDREFVVRVHFCDKKVVINGKAYEKADEYIVKL